MKHIATSIAAALFLVAAAPGEELTCKVDYNAITAGPVFRECWTGPIPSWYSPGQKYVRGSRNEMRAGGLVYEIDLYDTFPQVSIRTIPGFAHNENIGRTYRMNGPMSRNICGLGLISPGKGGQAESPAQQKNWTTLKLTYDFTSPETEQGRLEVTLSRLTPALLVSCTGPRVMLFGAPQYNNRIVPKGPWHGWGNVKENIPPANLATKTPDGRMHVARRDRGGSLPLSHLASGWLVGWWGKSNKVITYRGVDPMVLDVHSYSKQLRAGEEVHGDSPFLVVLEKAPKSVSLTDGLELAFDGPAGRLIVLPLTGIYLPAPNEWEKGLPADVIKAADFWAKHLRHFPVKVEEAYHYDPATGAARIRCAFEYEKLGGGEPMAPIPPMLALAHKYKLGVKFSGEVLDAGYPTRYGPMMGIAGTGYSYTVEGVQKYADEVRADSPAEPPAKDLQRELESEVDKILAAGLLAPSASVRPFMGRHGLLAWAKPGDNFRYLSQVAELLDADRREKVLDYVAMCGRKYPPDELTWIPPDAGAFREPWTPNIASLREYHRTKVGDGWGNVHSLANRCLPPDNLYGLSEFVRLGGDWPLREQWTKTVRSLTPHLAQSDWASLGWFRWPKHYAVHKRGGMYFRPARGDVGFGSGGTVDANCWFAGMAGFVRLARRAGDAKFEALGRCLLAKAAALRFGQAKFPTYLCDRGVVPFPKDPREHLRKHGGWYRNAGGGYLFPNEYKTPMDDVRQVSVMDDFGISLRATDTIWMAVSLVAHREIIPELGRFLTDHLREETYHHIRHHANYQPDWYVSFGDSVYGSEHGDFDPPEDSLQIFLVRAWVLDEKPDKLRMYRDVPWVPVGDYYYLAKLAETIRAHRGVKWKRTD